MPWPGLELPISAGHSRNRLSSEMSALAFIRLAQNLMLSHFCARRR
jgi:hypothetical protein